MIPFPIRQAARWTSPLTMLLLTLGLCIASDLALAAAVGDRVELRATHPAGVPLHSAPGGSQRFERVPGGTVATVIGLDRGGSWLELRVPDERTGWISARYVGRTMAGPPPPDTSAERTVWASPEGCQQVVSGGSRMSPADPATLRVGTWNIRWFPRGCPST